MKKIYYSILTFLFLSSSCAFAYGTSLKQFIKSVVSHSEFSYFFNTIVSLLFVIILVYVTAIMYKNLSRVNARQFAKIDEKTFQTNQISSLSSLPLGQNKSLQVVQINNKILLLGISEKNISLIREFDVNSVQGKLEEQFDEEKLKEIMDICDKYS